MTRFAVISVTLVCAVALSVVPACAARSAPSGKVYTPTQVSGALRTVFHAAPQKVLLGSGNATFFAFEPSGGRHFGVSPIVYRSLASADFIWRRKRASWRYSWFAVAKLNNVIALASPPSAKLDVKGRPFAMPAIVGRALSRLANGH